MHSSEITIINVPNNYKIYIKLILSLFYLQNGFAAQFSELLDKQLKASYLMCQEVSHAICRTRQITMQMDILSDNFVKLVFLCLIKFLKMLAEA